MPMIPYYIILPIASTESSDIEAALLKTTEDFDFSKIISQTRILNEENAILYYDVNKFNNLISMLKGENDVDYPARVKFIRKEINDWEEIDPFYDTPIIIADNIKIDKGIACAFCNDKAKNKVLVDTGDFIIKGTLLNSYSIIDCLDSELFTWLAKNREPKRIYDKNYEKHSKSAKKSGKGIISPINYKEDDVEEKLQWAVGEENGRMFLYDLAKKKILVFWFENVEHFYHAFNIDDDNKKEINKIWKQGGRPLVNKIQRIAEIYKENHV